MSLTNLRPFLWVALALILFVNYETWQKDYPPPAPEVAAPGTPAAAPLDAAPPAAPNAVDAGAVAAAKPASAAVAATGTEPALVADAGHISVITDVLELHIGLRGGELNRADILQYPRVKNESTPLRMLRRESADSLYVVQTGLAGRPGTGERPTHQAVFKTNFEQFKMLDGVDELRVPLSWTSDDGVTVTKTFVFHRGSYRIDLEYAVQNGSAADWQAASYAQILHDTPKVERSYFNVDTYAFEGPAIYDGTKYRKLKLDSADDAKLAQDISTGWLAALQHHFEVGARHRERHLQAHEAAEEVPDETHHGNVRHVHRHVPFHHVHHRVHVIQRVRRAREILLAEQPHLRTDQVRFPHVERTGRQRAAVHPQHLRTPQHRLVPQLNQVLHRRLRFRLDQRAHVLPTHPHEQQHDQHRQHHPVTDLGVQQEVLHRRGHDGCQALRTHLHQQLYPEARSQPRRSE
jgi:YidC/Oxa1 family membrane protein insertase